MKSAHAFCWVLTAVSMSALSAQGEDANFTQPLTQVRFDRLVPITYPVIRPNFARLRPTTEPLIHPGVPQVPITEGPVDWGRRLTCFLRDPDGNVLEFNELKCE